ncbi:DUF2207 domain-containing protein [Actinocorallia sp. API 0066]|uniref:DUF2207 domain-containing protein n=1 Tax=Actinocorallia sp. API 0066 TaxID=2896846 RepID=UPI001E39B5F2|nr:DUF2207 domain-containing protein [Actinocorallia sp. API 0066]MCD0450252.1 DUF2207 domain-containing protein [Actinocorallia sp. API 0066]
MLGRPWLIAAPLLLLLVPLAPAHASGPPTAAERRAVLADADDKVLNDEIVLTVGADGVLHATETVTFDHGTEAASRPVERIFITRIPDDATRDRTFSVDNVRVSGDVTAETVVGSDRTIVRLSGGRTGPQTFTLQYDITGSILPLNAAQEVRWTAVGWDVPVAAARVTLDAGVGVRNINCFAGSPSSVVGCSEFSTAEQRRKAVYGQENMLPEEYLTVAAALPSGHTTGAPSYEERKTLASSFAMNPVTGGALAALLVVLLGGFFLLYRLRGRDARAEVTETSHTEEPPDGIRPGQVGTLIDEQADVIDVAATVIDLAVRGYILIEEAAGKGDWTLRRLNRPVNDLLHYEEILYDGLFIDGDTVKLADLGGRFATKLAQVRAALYVDVVKQGWFHRRPDAVRSRWTILGYLATVVGAVGTVALAIFTSYALVGLGVLAFGLALTLFGKHMPAKTAKGSTVLAQTLGFQEHLRKGRADQVPDRQKIALFSRFLPYAVVLDAVGPWSKTVETAGVEGGDNLYWYEGPAEWDLSKFAESMRAFTFALSGALAQSRPYGRKAPKVDVAALAGQG